MSEAELPKLEEKKREEDKERRGAGAAWTAAGPGSGSEVLSAGQAASSSSLSSRVAYLGSKAFRGLYGEQLAWMRSLPTLGKKALLLELRQAALRVTVALAASWAATDIIQFAINRLTPQRERRVAAGGFLKSGRKSSPVPKGALPAEGLFGALPGLFSNKKGFLKDGSPVPDSSILKEGASAEGSKEQVPGAEAGPGAAEASAEGGVDRWAEALAQAQGPGGAGGQGFEKLPGLGGANGGFSGGAMGGAGARGDPGARGRGAAGGRGGGAGAPAGTLTAFKGAAPRRGVVAGMRMNRALPTKNNVRQRLVGTTIMSNEAAGIASNEASYTHAAAAFDANQLGAQAIPDPIGLGGAGAPGAGGGGGGVRPRSMSNINGGIPFDPYDGNLDILRPDLGGVHDTLPKPKDVPTGKNDTVYLRLVEEARQLADKAREEKEQGDAKKLWGRAMKIAGYGLIGACAIPGGGLVCARARYMIAAGLAAITAGDQLLRSSREAADRAEEVAEEIRAGFEQNSTTEAIDYCIAQARLGKECVFKADLTRAQACGFKPQMQTGELEIYARCMAESGAGLRMPLTFFPEGAIDPNNKDRLCTDIYRDARLVETGDPRHPYLCVRPGGR